MRQPAVIYTGAVYGAFKRDRGAGIKTGLFMEERGNTWAVVWIHTIQCVCLRVEETGCRGCVYVCVYMHGCLFACLAGLCQEKHNHVCRNDACWVSEWECM